MAGNNDVLLSQIDPDNPDLTNLAPAPSSLSIVDGNIVLTRTDASTEIVGLASIPVNNTISSAIIDGQGDLIVNYSDGSNVNLGKIKGTRQIVYTTTGSGVLTSQDGFSLTFSPLPINASLGLNKGTISPRSDKFKLENYSKFIALSSSQAGGRRRVGDYLVAPLNYSPINNANLPFYRSVVTLDPGRYYVRGHLTSHRNYHNMPLLYALADDEDISTATIINYGISSIGFTVCTATSTGNVSALINVTEQTKLALGCHAQDTRLTFNAYHGGVGFKTGDGPTYNCWATLEIWKLIYG